MPIGKQTISIYLYFSLYLFIPHVHPKSMFIIVHLISLLPFILNFSFSPSSSPYSSSPTRIYHSHLPNSSSSSFILRPLSPSFSNSSHAPFHILQCLPSACLIPFLLKSSTFPHSYILSSIFLSAPLPPLPPLIVLQPPHQRPLLNRPIKTRDIFRSTNTEPRAVTTGSQSPRLPFDFPA